MVPEGEERGGKFEDLFEDLDKFFAQGNPGPGRRGSGASEANEEEPAEELLPPGWEPDIEGLDLGSDPGADPHPPPGDEAPAGVGDDEAEPPTDRRKVEQPGEMAGEDWARLRDALGDEGKQAEDEEQVAQPGFAGERSVDETEEELFGFEGDEELGEAVALDTGEDREGRPELSLEDLKKAPPEYRDLPRSDEEEGPEELAEPVGEEEGVRARAEADEGQASEAPSPEEPYWDEPDMADMEEPEGPRTVRVGETEPMTGPTWEEPTSRPLMADQAAPPEPARNLPAAVLTAAVLAAVALVSLAAAKAAFAVVAGGVVLLGQAELYATMQRKGHQPATALGLVIGGFTLAGAYLKGEQAMAFFVVLGLMLAFLWYMAAVPKAREGALAHIGSTLLGVLYVPFLAGFILVILAQAESGRALMLAVL